MMMNSKILLLLGVIAVVQPAAGDFPPSCTERVLIPVIADAVPGNFGSIWQTRLAVTNHSDEPVSVTGYGRCDLSPCPLPFPIAPSSTIFPSNPRWYLMVECGRMNDVAMRLRVQDLSRQSQTWGTSVPVVREGDLFDGERMNIVDVPNSAEFRSMLRVYGFDGIDGQVSVRIYSLDPNIDEIGEGDLQLVELHETVAADSSVPMGDAPARLELPLWTVQELDQSERLRVEIEGPAGVRLFAFISATNNMTQHVTVLLPH
jgi:hypothetical protein